MRVRVCLCMLTVINYLPHAEDLLRLLITSRTEPTGDDFLALTGNQLVSEDLFTYAHVHTHVCVCVRVCVIVCKMKRNSGCLEMQ